MFKNFTSNQQGVASIEFALVALPFIMLVVAILELTMFYARAMVLEGATITAARTIRTGQAQLSANPLQTFETALCANIDFVMNCDDVIYEVIRPNSNDFAGASNLTPQFNTDGELISQGFDPGDMSDVVVVRAAYMYRFVTPLMGPILSGHAANQKLIMSTITIRNEPYDFES